MNCTHQNNVLSHDEFSLPDAVDYLTGLQVELESGSTGSGLLDFVRLLNDLLNVLEQHADEQEASNLTDFIQGGMAEVRATMDADKPSFEKVDTLFDQAIEAWGELLLAAQDSQDCHALDAWPAPANEQANSEGAIPSAAESAELSAADFHVPSAADVQSLLQQLGQKVELPAARMEAAAESQQTASAPERGESANVSVGEIDALDPELREAFMDDASSCLSSMENSLLRLESNPQDRDSLNQILRELHTLKGASGSVGLTSLAEQIHALEDTLREHQVAGRTPPVDMLLENLDRIRSQVGGTSPSVERPAEPSAENATTTTSLAAAPPSPTPAPIFSDEDTDDELVRVKSSQLNRLMDMLVELVMLRNQRETELSDLQEVYHELIHSVSKMRLLSNDNDTRADSSSSLQLSEVASDVLEIAQHLRDRARPFADGNAAVSRFIRQFRLELVQLRRTPIAGLFRRLQRVVRDAARSESKQVRLTLLGEDAGIERSLQQRLYEPLLHIVRNCVSHGIETPEERTSCGKQPEGVISLEAISGPDLFVIEIRDDGRGLNYDAIRRRGLERGLLSPDQTVSNEELSQLIFHPGFSTREVANQLSGRGVGLDVVAATMQRMRGWLEVTSEPGSGTRIRLSFPLPSAIQHAMVFRCGEQLFALPMESVQATGEVAAEIPRTNFSRLLGIDAPSASEAGHHAIVIADDHHTSSNAKSSPLALCVEEIIGPEELVVRPLPTLLKHHPYCAGATLSGMGQTVILLDARRLLRSQQAPLSSMTATGRTDSQSKGESSKLQRPRVLVVDDSLSARKRVVRSLGRFPVDVVEANDGKAALALLKNQQFAAVFSDMEMPNVNGMEFLAEVNSADRRDPPPVVIISSRSEPEFTERAKKLGAANYLIKPLADEALDAALTKIPTLSHLVRDPRSTQLEISQ